MKIPKSFKLFGQTIDVVIIDDLTQKTGGVGMAHINCNTIAIQPDATGYTRKEDQLHETFLHELTHMILHHMSEDALKENEKFVDIFASLLHQALTTMEYETKKK